MGGKTKQIMAGGVAIGGGAPLSIQSMTNTKTADAEGTLAQLERLAQAGCQIARLAVPDLEITITCRALKCTNANYRLRISGSEALGF